MGQLTHRETGRPIIGTSERILGIAIANSFTQDGEPDYSGSTDVDWNTQETITREGKTLYMTDDGREVTLDECDYTDD
jgi:hypothetical protein